MADSDQGLVEKEIRFAVVMYGGVSLAIYINGVAQELLKMVRATGPEQNAGNFDSTEKIYHRLACLVSDPELLERASQKTEKEEIDRLLKDDLSTVDCSSTKFVVDIISGTSAGGINGVFLAKALVRNQNIEELKKLWLNEGDIAKLINDKKSVSDIALKAPGQAKSLLNSQRMYLKLLEAVDGMDDSAPVLTAEDERPLINEMDLFITVTDYQGVSVPLRLLDRVIFERRYRQVFHFQHNPENDRFDFSSEHNPMLAFAARCTSAFPFAFEPMRISQAKTVIREAFSNSAKRVEDLENDKTRFFPLVKDKSGNPVDWGNRDLVDGGYLDNKPFSYAIDALSQRRADFQVERKLLYVEPSPENLGLEDGLEQTAPDAIQNAKAAVSELPRYETIREDLQRVLERNRLIERVNRLSASSERDVYTYLTTTEAEKWNQADGGTGRENGSDNEKDKEEKPKTGAEWEKFGLESIVKLKGHAVLPYYRLRISSLTDDIARLVTRKLGIEVDSEYFLAIRSLVNVWRKDNFVTYLEEQTSKEKGKDTVLAFLRWYDLNYRLRRFRFVQQKASQLSRFEPEFRERLNVRQAQLAQIRKKQFELADQKDPEKNKKKGRRGEPEIKPQADSTEQAFVEEKIAVPKSILEMDGERLGLEKDKTSKEEGELMPSEIIWKVCGGSSPEKNSDQINNLRKIVFYYQTRLRSIFGNLQLEKEKLVSGKAETDKLSRAIQSVELKPDDLKQLLEITGLEREAQVSEKMLRDFLENKYRELYQPIKKAAHELKDLFDKIFETSRSEIHRLLQTPVKDLPEELKGMEPVFVNSVRGYLLHFYKNFDDYDQISFPVFYETDVGEAVPVDVLRISPVDAKSLIDEESLKETRRKLAGTALYNFGAFIDRVWRKNDIMWGRLDGAERIITAILPGEKYDHLRNYFAGEMNRIILNEELMQSDKEELRSLLAGSLARVGAGINLENAVREVTGDITDGAVKNRLAAVMRTCFDEEQIVGFVKNVYEVERKTEPSEILRVISRATQVTGNIFEEIADQHGKSGDRLRWVSRLGRVFWGLVEVAAPNTIWNKIFRHWLKLLYLFEVILIFGATIFNEPKIQQFGIIVLLVTLITNLVVLNLDDYMRGNKFGRLIRFLVVSFLLVLCLFGFLSLFALVFDPELWRGLSFIQNYLGGFGLWPKLIPPVFLFLLFGISVTWPGKEKPNLRAVGIVSLSYVLVSVILAVVFNRLTSEAHGLNGLGPILSLEMIENPKQLAEIAPPNSPGRIGLIRALALDSFLFIPIYTGFLLYFSRLFNLRKGKWIQRALIACTVLIPVAAGADYLENYFSFSLLQPQMSEIPQWMFNATSAFARTKFGLIALTAGLFAGIFWRPTFWAGNLLALALLGIGTLGLAGLIFPWLIQPFLSLLTVLILIVGIGFTVRNEKFFPDQ
ncbi:MAG: patatin-like protein [Pyrinomonadaceae bacterium]